MRKSLAAAIAFMSAFAVWTVMVCYVDVQAIGPLGSKVGLAGFNSMVHRLTGVNYVLYTITDWLGLVPAAICIGFGMLGMIQWIMRKRVFRVDRSILILGGYYVVVIGLYLLFEAVVVNYRPVVIDGYLEASYPSSTTLLTLCVMPTAMLQLNARMGRGILRRSVIIACAVFTVFMVVGRIISGVHWITDIIGGMLLSAGLVTLYYCVCGGKLG